MAQTNDIKVQKLYIHFIIIPVTKTLPFPNWKPLDQQNTFPISRVYLCYTHTHTHMNTRERRMKKLFKVRPVQILNREQLDCNFTFQTNTDALERQLISNGSNGRLEEKSVDREKKGRKRQRETSGGKHVRDRWPVKASWQSAERELNRKKFGLPASKLFCTVLLDQPSCALVEESEAGQSDTAAQSRARGWPDRTRPTEAKDRSSIDLPVP